MYLVVLSCRKCYFVSGPATCVVSFTFPTLYKFVSSSFCACAGIPEYSLLSFLSILSVLSVSIFFLPAFPSWYQSQKCQALLSFLNHSTSYFYLIFFFFFFFSFPSSIYIPIVFFFSFLSSHISLSSFLTGHLSHYFSTSNSICGTY